MSNLLDKASIILTPTAYNNGEALCVKPSDGSGDFDFSRNSAATRVNAQGLVENVQILSSNLVQNGSFSEEGVQEVSNGSFSQEGSELITNGDFSNGSTGWSKSTQVTIENGVANIISNDGSFQVLVQNNITTIGKSYVLTYTIVSNNDGGLKLGNIGEINSAIGTHSFYFVATETPINIARNSGITDITIDNVSVREVAQNWTLGTGWSIGEDKAVATNAPSDERLQQNNVFTVGKTYKITYEITELTQGFFKVYVGGTFLTSQFSVGVYTEYKTIPSNSVFYVKSSGTTSGSITNISVKEVGQDWDILNDVTSFSFENGIANIQGTANSPNNGIKQASISAVIGKTYKISATLRSNDGGLYRFRLLDGSYFDLGSGNSTEFETITSYHTATSTAFTIFATSWFTNGTANFDISNISIIEISTDTNLPRINYEGFSYQDALGSELVVNGDFATDSDWTKGVGWTISGGSANGSSTTGDLRQDPVVENGKYYKVTYTISNYVSGSVRFEIPSNIGSGIERSANGTYTEILLSSGTAIQFDARTAFTGSIDNVSVKEYLGQEVVPDSGCGSWLWEPQSTNLVTDSQNYNSTYWSGQRGTLSDGGVGLFYLSPTSNVIKYEVTTTGFNQLYYRLPSAVTIGNTYTQQGYVKCDDAPYIIFQIQPLTGNPSIVWDNINNVVISSDPSIDSFNITSLNGWVKAEITYTATVASIYASLKTYFSTTTSNTQGVPIGTIAYQTFVQVEQQSYATSYIPTEGSTVTRNQDVCTNGGSLASINSTEGVLYAEIAALADDLTNRGLSISDGTSSNACRIYYINSSNRIRFFFKVGGNAQVIKTIDLTNITDYNKIAFSYKQDDFKIYINGLKVDEDTSGIVPSANTFNKLSFDRGYGGENFFGKTKCLAVWKEALTDAELTELTTI